MITRRLRRLLPVMWILFATVGIASCGSGVTGTYHDATGNVSLDLQSGGKAHISVMGEQHDLTYKVEGNKITLHDPADAQGDEVVATLNSDGTLALAMWTLKKK